METEKSKVPLYVRQVDYDIYSWLKDKSKHPSVKLHEVVNEILRKAMEEEK